jgi:hypothetical protein
MGRADLKSWCVGSNGVLSIHGELELEGAAGDEDSGEGKEGDADGDERCDAGENADSSLTVQSESHKAAASSFSSSDCSAEGRRVGSAAVAAPAERRGFLLLRVRDEGGDGTCLFLGGMATNGWRMSVAGHCGGL